MSGHACGCPAEVSSSLRSVPTLAGRKNLLGLGPHLPLGSEQQKVHKGIYISHYELLTSTYILITLIMLISFSFFSLNKKKCDAWRVHIIRCINILFIVEALKGLAHPASLCAVWDSISLASQGTCLIVRVRTNPRFIKRYGNYNSDVCACWISGCLWTDPGVSELFFSPKLIPRGLRICFLLISLSLGRPMFMSCLSHLGYLYSSFVFFPLLLMVSILHLIWTINLSFKYGPL